MPVDAVFDEEIRVVNGVIEKMKKVVRDQVKRADGGEDYVNDAGEKCSPILKGFTDTELNTFVMFMDSFKFLKVDDI